MPGAKQLNAFQASEVIRIEKLTLQAVSLRAVRMTYPQIAAQIGCSTSAAHQYVKKGLQRMRDDTQEAIEDLRDLEGIALDRLQGAVMVAALDPSNAKHEYAHRECLSVMQARWRLFGLEAPVKSEVTGAGGGPLLVAPVIASPAETARLVRVAFGPQAAMKNPNAGILAEAFGGNPNGSVSEPQPALGADVDGAAAGSPAPSAALPGEPSPG